MVTESKEYNSNSTKAISINDLITEYNIETIDILKIDIEGSEKELFEKNFDYWLSKTKLLIIEIHDGMRKGSSKAVFNALNDFEYVMELKGENHIFWIYTKQPNLN